ncbi:MAG: STAS domain-containing protein [Deltaproteobacteria bacterium]|nr:STAS domain-containing protein [Deltaproteobacteria bacterium]
MEISCSAVGDVLVVVPEEKRIDAYSAPDFKGRMVDWINSGHTRLILDLSCVEFIDSSGLGAMVSTLKTIGNRGDLVICGVQKAVMNLFQLTRMNRVFRIFPSREEALTSLSG